LGVHLLCLINLLFFPQEVFDIFVRPLFGYIYGQLHRGEKVVQYFAPLRNALLCHEGLRAIFYSLLVEQGIEATIVMSKIYAQVVEGALRFTLGGDLFPVLKKKLREQLKTKGVNEKASHPGKPSVPMTSDTYFSALYIEGDDEEEEEDGMGEEPQFGGRGEDFEGREEFESRREEEEREEGEEKGRERVRGPNMRAEQPTKRPKQ
jgi:hypothetical protein